MNKISQSELIYDYYFALPRVVEFMLMRLANITCIINRRWRVHFWGESLGLAYLGLGDRSRNKVGVSKVVYLYVLDQTKVSIYFLDTLSRASVGEGPQKPKLPLVINDQ